MPGRAGLSSISARLASLVVLLLLVNPVQVQISSLHHTYVAQGADLSGLQIDDTGRRTFCTGGGSFICSFFWSKPGLAGSGSFRNIYIYICVYLYKPYVHRYMMHMSYVYTYMISKYFALHIYSEHTLDINAYLNTHVSICGAYNDKLFKYVYIYIYMYLFTILLYVMTQHEIARKSESNLSDPNLKKANRVWDLQQREAHAC